MCRVLTIREGEQAVNLNPQFVLGHDTLAGLFLKSNQINLAEHYAREALRLLPSDQTAVPGELLFRVTTGHVTLSVLNARLMRPYVHPLNVADFKDIHAG
jgi:hypothetical protein